LSSPVDLARALLRKTADDLYVAQRLAADIDLDRQWAVGVAQRTTQWAAQIVHMDSDTSTENQ
jgi:hypothetical protein